MKLIFALITMAANAVAATGDPGESALRFLAKVRAGEVNLEPGGDTAISPQTSERKRREIARRLDRMARDLATGELEVGAVKLDEDLAAVLVRKLGGFDPARLQVVPLALVKRGATWAVAPVPASFENSGVGYATALRERLATLEDWMLRQQVTDLESLREQSARRLRGKVEHSLPADKVRAMSSQQVGERFLAACEEGKLIEILGLLGGLAANLPENWSERLRSAEAAIQAPADATRPWRLLTAPEVLRIPVYHDDDPDGKHAILSVACLDPAGNPPRSKIPKVELVHLSLVRLPDGIWRVDPPAAVTEDAEDLAEDGDPDESLLDMFPAKLALKHPAEPTASAAAIRDGLLAAFAKDKPSSWLRLVRMQGDPADQRNACARAAQIWWEIRNPAAAKWVAMLDFFERGELAAAACQFFDARNPDRPDLRMLVFEKTPMGWLWNPAPSDQTLQLLESWEDTRASGWADRWQAALLTESPVLERFPDAAPPSDEEARKVVESWFQAAKSGDVAAALRLTTRLKQVDSDITLLRNLGYEIAGMRRHRRLPVISGVVRGTAITTVATRAESDDKPVFPLYSVVATAAGPRILLEVDLIASSNRGRAFLNRTSLERLRDTSPHAADELAAIYAKHQAATTAAPKP